MRMVDYRNSDKIEASVPKGSDSAIAWKNAIDRPAHCDPVLLSQLKDAALSRNGAELGAVVSEAQAFGVPAEALADHYIPAIARDLGTAWCVDELGFADVTIGSARLQSVLREIGECWSADQNECANSSTVLLIVPEGAYHTLGALVLSGQLRRKGLSVRLLLGANPEKVQSIFEHSNFDSVFISAVAGERLEILRKLIEAIKIASVVSPPVVIGGTLLELEEDVAALTGADYVTNYADEAISLCNLRTKPRNTSAMDL